MSTLPRLLKNTAKPKAVIGFDGFVDEVVYVVDKRIDTEHYTRINTIKEYGERITAAQGLSCNFEYVPVKTKLGGNGPILANALLQLGTDVEYIGALGNPINPVFENITINGTAHSICDCAHTDAVEFQDGKVIISKLDAFKSITFERLLELFSQEQLVEILQSADLVGFENWTMIPGLSQLLMLFLDTIAPALEKGKLAFFDLADPQKRTREDIAGILQIIQKSKTWFRPILGMNLKEAWQIAAVLGAQDAEKMELEALCSYIGKEMDIHAVVIHPTDKACAWCAGEYVQVAGPYCENPVLTTGAGDNFNAGLCFGLLHGGTLEEALTAGVMTSGFYVRNGRSPTSKSCCISQ